MICIVLAIIIIIILFIIIYNKEKFNDYISSNHSILDTYSYNELGSIEEIIDPITKMAYQSKYISCNKEGTGDDEEEDQGSQGSQGSQKELKDWFLESDIKVGGKIKCPNNNNNINIGDICKKDDWYKECLSDKGQSAITEGSKFCLNLCSNDNHHLRKKNQNDQQSSSAPGERGGSSGRTNDDFDICQFIDENGRPWFAEKSGTGDNEKRKCPSSNIYINSAKICRPKTRHGLYMGGEEGAPTLLRSMDTDISDNDLVTSEKKKQYYFFCKDTNSTTKDWKIDEQNNIKFPSGSDTFCCPKVKMTLDTSDMYPEGSNYAAEVVVWDVPILNTNFCKHIWKGGEGDYKYELDDPNWGDNHELLWTGEDVA